MSAEEKKKESVREKIVLTAIEVIEQKGVQATTVRDIAGAAGVNVAAINYYFGTKEKLIGEALTYTLENFFGDTAEIMGRPGLSPREIMRELLTYYFDGAIRYPGITRAHLHEPLMRGNYGGPLVGRFNVLLSKMSGRLKTGQGNKELRLSIAQMLSAVFFVAIAPKFFQGFTGMDFNEPKARRSYIEHLLEKYSPENRQ